MNLWNNLMYDLLNYLGIVLRGLALYVELTYYIKRKLNFIRYTLPFEKGLGKSYTLLKLSEKYNIPIIVRTEEDKDKLIINKTKYMDLKGNPQVLIYDNFNEYYEILLVDEGLTTEEVHKLRHHADAVIGYVVVDIPEAEEN